MEGIIQNGKKISQRAIGVKPILSSSYVRYSTKVEFPGISGLASNRENGIPHFLCPTPSPPATLEMRIYIDGFTNSD